VVGADLKRWLDERYKADVEFIPNGVENRTHRVAHKIEAMGLQADGYVLYLARLVPEKQVHVLIDAWMGLASKQGKKLAIAGPTWHSREYVERLKRLAASDESVAFLGEVDEEALEELYSNCAAYVLPSEVEGMSLSLLDAMAFGACVVCSDIPPNLAVIGDAGLSFRVGDAADLREKIAQLLADPAKAKSLGAAARQRIDSEFAWERIVERWDRLYRELG
jgi:glycosyltransferase involved in cell wall biosynthesis